MNRKSLLLAAAGGVAAFAAVGASASTLGGMSSTALGSEQTIVAACDSDGITIDYTTAYDSARGGYKVTEVKLGGMAAACTGQNVKVTLAAESGPLAELSATVSGAAQTLPVVENVSAAAITSAAVTISG